MIAVLRGLLRRLLGWIAFRLIMAWPGRLPAVSDSSLFARALAWAGDYVTPPHDGETLGVVLLIEFAPPFRTTPKVERIGPMTRVIWGWWSVSVLRSNLHGLFMAIREDERERMMEAP